MKPNDPAGILPRLPHGADILIIRLRSLGDVVMLTPALAALHAWRPDLRVNVLVEPAFAAVLDGNPAVSRIILYRDFLSASLKLRSRGFPVVFNQHAGPTSALLTAAIGAPLRVCWAGRQFSIVYNVVTPAEYFYGPRKMHTVEHRLTQFYWCGLPQGPIPRPQVFPQDASREAARIILTEHGIDPSRPYAVIHPGASATEKRWPLEKFAAVARWLREERRIQIVAILGPGERAIQAEVQQQLGHAIFAPLAAVIALIARARLFVGNDSGPAHLATASGCPPVVIFGPTDSEVWRPWQVEHRVVENPARDIAAIPVDDVQRACEELLA